MEVAPMFAPPVGHEILPPVAPPAHVASPEVDDSPTMERWWQ
jgi:hypothetical protein